MSTIALMTDEVRKLVLARRLVETGTARTVRETAGLSRAEMAKASGVSVAAIRAWESGWRRPRGSQGEAYGRVLSNLMTGCGQVTGIRS